MTRRVEILTHEERQACERAGRAALDAVLAPLGEAERAAIWHSIRCGYVQPVTGAATAPEADPRSLGP